MNYFTNISEVIDFVESKNFKTCAEKICAFMEEMHTPVDDDEHEKINNFLETLGFEKNASCAWCIRYKRKLDDILNVIHNYKFSRTMWFEGDDLDFNTIPEGSEIFIFIEPDEDYTKNKWNVEMSFYIPDWC